MPVHVKIKDTSEAVDVEVRRICTHKDLEIQQPCCTSPDSDGLIACGCGGQLSATCPDCDLSDLSDEEFKKLIEERS